jgi:O-antigen biosynthesis protein
MKPLSIVIPVHNHWELTKQCIGSIRYSTTPEEDYEMIVVDDCSNDQTEEFLQFQINQGYPIKIIKNEETLSYLLSANKGWKEVESPYCLHLNNDVVVDRNCIKYMLDGFASDPKIGIMGGIQFTQTDPQNLWRYNKTLFRRGDEVDNYKDLRYLTSMTEEELNSPAVEVEAAGFQCAIVSEEVWDKIGYYDEQFVPCMSEQEDYFLRTLEAGFKIAIAPKAHFLHYIGASTSDNFGFYQNVVIRNEKLFKDKWKEKLRKYKI